MYWWGCGEKVTPDDCWWECKLVQPQWETIRQFLKTLNAELPYDPAIPSQVYTEKQNKNTNSKRCMLIRALFTTAKIGKQPEYPSTDEWIKKMWDRYIYIYISTHTHIHTYTHTHKMEYFLSHKKKWNFAICRHMDGPGRHYAKWNKTDK